MSPATLSPNVLHILLQYISPPSQLTHSIPPHLLSKSLLQRHHFLHLSPQQPDDYLCWPSSPERKARVIDLLETRFRPLDDEPAVYPVQYSFDGEDFFAHVDLSNDVGDGPRVILQWDDSGEWKYHNADLMPFPPGSRVALDDVLVPPPPPNPVSVQPLSRPSCFREFDPDDFHEDEDEDDDYWNAYGSTDIGDSHYGQSAPTSAKDAISSEDAYWAQYASVHGTADSTIPSPAPHRKPLPAHLHQQDSQTTMESPVPLSVPVRVPSEDMYAEPLPIPPGIMPRSHSRWDPASPTTLTRLLSTISPRRSPVPSPTPGSQFIDIDADADETFSSPTVGGSNDSDMSSSPALGLEGTDVMVETTPGGSLAPVLGHGAGTQSVLEIGNGSTLVDGGEDEAELRAVLEGVWRMWKTMRTKAAGEGATSGDSEAREAFLRTAQLVVDGPYA